MRIEDILQVQWQFIENDEDHPDHVNENHGVLLTVGFLPGLKVSLIPLLSKTRVTFSFNITLTYFRNKSVILRGCLTFTVELISNYGIQFYELPTWDMKQTTSSDLNGNCANLICNGLN